MTSYIPTASASGTGYRWNFSSDNDGAYIAAGLVLGSTGGASSSVIVGAFSFLNVVVDGTLVGDLSGISIGNDASHQGNRVTVGSTGAVYGFFSTAVTMGGHHHKLSNAGTLFGARDGVWFNGTNANVKNSGSIEGGSGDGIEAAQNFSLTNSGSIVGQVHGVEIINHAANGTSTIVNSGTISSSVNDVIAHRSELAGYSGNLLYVTNSGIIEAGPSTYAIYSYSGAGNREIVTNTGTIRGPVYLGDGNDTIDTSKGISTGAISLGDGEDKAFGSARADNIFGGAGADSIVGNAGNDILTGESGRDTLTGSSGSDTFQFLAITDSGTSTTTRDYITDFTKGDKIALGAIDAFSSSAPTNEVFASVTKGTATSAFGGEGRIVYYWDDKSGTANDRTIIRVNNDFDASNDMTIELRGLITLTASDFIL